MSDTILYFRADWCGPCRQAAKVFETLKADHPNVEFRKVDVDEEPEIAKKYAVRAIPTMIYIRGGQEVARASGARSPKETAALLGLT